jgi:hypothetical protein
MSADTIALDVMRQVYALGGRLRLEEGNLFVEAPQPLPEAVRQAVREYKSAIMVALGAPLDAVAASVLEEIRPYLPESLRRLPDSGLLALVNWSIIAAWNVAVRRLGRGERPADA